MELIYTSQHIIPESRPQAGVKGGYVMDDMGCGSGFRQIIKNLVGDTVTVYVETASFFGRLADAESGYLTVATRRGSSVGIHLTYVPFSKVQAISEQ